MELEAAGVGGLPRRHRGTGVGVEVVDHGVDHLAWWDAGVQEVEEGDEDGSRSTLGHHPQDLSGVDIQAGGQAAGAMADVLSLALGKLTRPSQREIGEATLQSLDAGLLVD